MTFFLPLYRTTKRAKPEGLSARCALIDTVPVVPLVADRAGIRAGMAASLVPCAGIIVISALLWKRSDAAGREGSAAEK